MYSIFKSFRNESSTLYTRKLQLVSGFSFSAEKRTLYMKSFPEYSNDLFWVSELLLHMRGTCKMCDLELPLEQCDTPLYVLWHLKFSNIIHPKQVWDFVFYVIIYQIAPFVSHSRQSHHFARETYVLFVNRLANEYT